MKKKTLYFMLFPLELSLVLTAFIITLFQKKPFISLFTMNAGLPAFIIIILSGMAAGLCVSMATRKFRNFSEMRELVEKLVVGFRLSVIDILIIALTAAICEEILFRAVLQPMWGIWITSLVFILLHGYFNPLNWKMSLFGLIMFCLSLGIGSIYISWGLVPAMAFHFAYDFSALIFMRNLVSNL